MPYHKKGRNLLGRDPDDVEVDALAFGVDGNLIREGIEPVKRGKYDSLDGIRDAARNRKAARDMTAKADALNQDATDAEPDAVPGDLPEPQTPAPTVETVVAGRFGAPLKTEQAKPKGRSHIKPEYMKNFDRPIGFDP